MTISSSRCGQSLDFIYYILAGVLVGLAVGITGVGGGSLMTPILLAFGFPLHIAVGTDLIFASVTKSGGVLIHAMHKNVRWDLVLLLASGSVPATVLTILVLKYRFHGPAEYHGLITTTLGVTMILASIAILLRGVVARMPERTNALAGYAQAVALPAIGIVLGILVTLSSVGAGAIGGAMLMLLYPRLKGSLVAGTGLAIALPLTLFAGLGHLYLGNVDFRLLLALLIGSLPSVALGSRLSNLVPERYMRPILATTLLGVGVRFALF